MSIDIDEVVEEMTKKWKIPREEALNIARRLMASSQPQAQIVPTPSNPFPQPLGEISRKVLDINQAALSTAYTLRMLKAPPEDVAALREELQETKSYLSQLEGSLKTIQDEYVKKLEEIKRILDEKERQEMLEQLNKQFEARLEPINRALENVAKSFEQINKKIEEIEKKASTPPPQPQVQVIPQQPQTQQKEEEKPQPQLTLAPQLSLLREVNKLKDEIIQFLQETGYKVEPERVTKDEVMRLLEEERKKILENIPEDIAKKKLEEKGYKVMYGYVPYEKVEELVRQAYEKGRSEAISDRRTEIAADIIKRSVEKVIEIFGPAVQAIFNQLSAQAQTRLNPYSIQAIQQMLNTQTAQRSIETPSQNPQSQPKTETQNFPQNRETETRGTAAGNTGEGTAASQTPTIPVIIVRPEKTQPQEQEATNIGGQEENKQV